MQLRLMLNNLMQCADIYNRSLTVERRRKDKIEIIRVYPGDGLRYMALEKRKGEFVPAASPIVESDPEVLFSKSKLCSTDEDWKWPVCQFHAIADDLDVFIRLVKELQESVG